jgi:recombinational DNA repair protein RecT
MTDQAPAIAKDMTPQAQFAARVNSYALDFLAAIAPPDKVQQAAGRIGLALRKAAIKQPKLYSCDAKSVANAIAMSALTGIYPGGAKPLVDLIPRGNNLEWQISARGLQALAQRVGGWIITATPVHVEDVYEVTLGTEQHIKHIPCGKGATTWLNLAAVYVVGTHKDWPRVIVPVPLDIIRQRSTSTEAWTKWPVPMAQKTAVIYTISRGHFGALEAEPEFSAIADYQDTHRESAPARATPRPAAMEYTVDAEDLDDLEVAP